MQDSYTVIARESKCEIKIKGSRFIGESFLVSSPKAVEEKLLSVRKREHAASHHCFAWQVGLFEDQQFKYSDDGEPSGTAGRPIYDLLAGSGISNLLVVVTRYFGGTKLGTGGLVRAYSEAAKMVIEKSGSESRYLTDRLRIEIDFTYHDRVQRLLHAENAQIIGTDYSDRVVLTSLVRRSRTDPLIASLTEMTSGGGKVERIETE